MGKIRKILTLDCGTKTGWAYRGSDGSIESGVQDFTAKRGESPGMRYLYFRRWLMGILVGVELCVYEQAHHRGGAATALLVGMTTRIEELCAVAGIPCGPVHSATLKKHATGSGAAKKEKMIEKAARLFPLIEIIDDNHADALLLMNYAIKEIDDSPILFRHNYVEITSAKLVEPPEFAPQGVHTRTNAGRR